jgi:hypothetical protein
LLHQQARNDPALRALRNFAEDLWFAAQIFQAIGKNDLFLMTGNLLRRWMSKQTSPIPIASKIFRRVPPPTRSGTT